MWIYTRQGMISIVQHRDNQDVFLVRSRERSTLEDLFRGFAIIELEAADYPFRVFVNRDELPIIYGMIAGINFPNFKNSVKDPERHDVYFDVYNASLGLERRPEVTIEDDKLGDGELAPGRV